MAPRLMDDPKQEFLRSQIAEAHVRLGQLMDERLADVETGDLEKYFAVLSRLVGKLEEADKSLKTVAKEMVAETAAMVMAELAE